MKAIKMLLPVLFVLLTGSCKKDDNNNTSPNNNGGNNTTVTTGSIQFVNNSSNPYTVYVNGIIVHSQPGKTTWSISEAPGTYSAEVKQQSGYVLYPTDLTYSMVVTSGGNSVVSYP